jgi:hypothetical protein
MLRLPLGTSAMLADCGFSLRTTTGLPPAATILVTSPVASLPPSSADPAPPADEIVAAVQRIIASDEGQEPQQGEVVGIAWWEVEQWDDMLWDDNFDFLAISLEQLTDGKPLAAVPPMALKALACQLRAKSAAGNKRAAVSGRGPVGSQLAGAACCSVLLHCAPGGHAWSKCNKQVQHVQPCC